MADIYIYDGDADDLDCMGLVGALTPLSCTHEENANGMSELTLTHPYDELGKWATLEIGRIVKAPVPVRTCPEIADGQIVTSVETWTVLATATKAQRYVYSKRRGGKKKKLLKPGTSVTVVLKPAESDRYKIRTGSLNGWIASAALQYEAAEVLDDDPNAIDAVAPAWTVRDQLFRIYSIQKKNAGVTARARHISYDLLGNNTTYVESGTVSAQTALDALLDNCVTAHEFEAFTDSANTRTGMAWERVNPIDALLEEENGFAARFGCDLVRDDYELYLLTEAGKNRGIRIEYGKNLEDVVAEIDVDNLVTRIIPVGETKAGDKLYLTDYEDGQNWIDSPYIGNYPEPHVHVLECSDCKVGSGGVTTALARTRMRAQAEKMFADGCDVPAMKLTVNFVSLAKTDQYQDFADLEKVFLYDTVSVYHAHIGVTASAKVTRGVWNVPLERWDSMDLETSEFTTPAWENYFRNSLKRLRDETKQQLFRLSVEYSNGTCLDSDTTSTTATVHLFKNNADVTDKHAASCFSWTRATKTGTAEQQAADATWNAAHEGSKSVTLGIADIDGNAVIRCNAVIRSKTTTYELTGADTVFFKRDGKDGSKIEYIFALTETNAAPALDTAAVQTDDCVPTGWTDDPAGISLERPYEWMAMRVKENGAWSAFSAPALWAHYGKDGDTTEYIFCRTADFATPALTTAAIQQDDYVPSGWEDNALGIDAEHPYEWMAMRTKSDELWSAFTTPTLWSHYGADGVDGNDGTVLEYVYARSATDVAPALDTAAVQQNDFVPAGWQDEPVTLTASYPYGWIAVRSKSAGAWSAFSSPALWAHFGKDGAKGADGSIMEFIYRRTSTETAPALDTAAVQTDDYAPSGWTDNPSGVTVSLPFEWISTRLKAAGTWGTFSAPALWAKYGKDGTDGTSVEYVYRRTTTAAVPALTTTAVQTDNHIPSGWTDDPTGVDAAHPYEWISTRAKVAGTWSAFAAPSLWTHYGKDGEKGVDGTSIEYIYCRAATTATPTLNTTAIQQDDYVPSGWTDDPTGVNVSYPYEWISTRTKTAGTWSAFAAPKLWAHYGKDGANGANGADGTSTEYIYCRSTTATAPSLNTAAVQTNDYIPSGWTDNPTGVNASYPYEWVSTRVKQNGTWSAFTTPAIWSHYGTDGTSVEYIYRRTTSASAPALTTTAVQSNDYVPSGWTDNPSGVTATYLYEWVSTRTKAAGTWSAFTSPTLWAKYGQDGAQGPQGLSGADGTRVYYSSSYPSGSGYNTGDLWYVVSGTSVIALYRYTGSSWSQLKYDTGALVVGNIVTGSAVANVLTAAMVNALAIYTDKLYSTSHSSFRAQVGDSNSTWGDCGIDFFYNNSPVGSINVDTSYLTVVGNGLRLIGYGSMECHTSRYSIGFTLNEESAAISWTGDMLPSVTSTSSGSGYRLGTTTYRWRHVYVRSGSYTGSDLRIKEHIMDMDKRAVSFILSLRPLEYTLIGDPPEKRHWGFGAQHVKTALGEIGYMDDHDVFEHEDEENLGLNYQELFAPLVFTVQNQEKRIAALENENQALRARLDAIERRLEGKA